MCRTCTKIHAHPRPLDTGSKMAPITMMSPTGSTPDYFRSTPAAASQPQHHRGQWVSLKMEPEEGPLNLSGEYIKHDCNQLIEMIFAHFERPPFLPKRSLPEFHRKNIYDKIRYTCSLGFVLRKCFTSCHNLGVSHSASPSAGGYCAVRC